MVAGQRGIKKYVADMEIYLECIVEEENAARDSIGDMEADREQERDDLLNKKYNAAVDEMERLAAQFNAEVQAYKAKDIDFLFQIEPAFSDNALKNFDSLF